MVRLRLGRFASELYYTRTKAVLPREEVRRRIALVAGHLGYITGLFEYIMTDILHLRFFALSGCVLIVGYQLSQPKIQWLSACWNSVFSFVNIYHIAILLWPLPPLSEEEAALFNSLGERLTKKQFHKLLAAGQWQTLEDGELLSEEGHHNPLRCLCLISAGECDVFEGGVPMGSVGRGGVVGEIGPLTSRNEGGVAPAVATVIAKGSVRCLCLPEERLQQEPDLLEALQGVLAVALAQKYIALCSQTPAHEYAALVELACASEGEAADAVRAEAAAYRELYGISDQLHLKIAQEAERRIGRSPNAVDSSALQPAVE